MEGGATVNDDDAYKEGKSDRGQRNGERENRTKERERERERKRGGGGSKTQSRDKYVRTSVIGGGGGIMNGNA